MADRFHLLCNVSETVERVLTRKHRRLREAAHHDPPSAAERNLTGPEQQTQARRGTRVHRYATVRRLYQAGMSQTEIARTMAMSRNTVSKYIRAEGFPERLGAVTRSGEPPPVPCAPGCALGGGMSQWPDALGGSP